VFSISSKYHEQTAFLDQISGQETMDMWTTWKGCSFRDQNDLSVKTLPQWSQYHQSDSSDTLDISCLHCGHCIFVVSPLGAGFNCVPSLDSI